MVVNDDVLSDIYFSITASSRQVKLIDREYASRLDPHSLVILSISKHKQVAEALRLGLFDVVAIVNYTA